MIPEFPRTPSEPVPRVISSKASQRLVRGGGFAEESFGQLDERVERGLPLRSFVPSFVRTPVHPRLLMENTPTLVLQQSRYDEMLDEAHRRGCSLEDVLIQAVTDEKQSPLETRVYVKRSDGTRALAYNPSGFTHRERLPLLAYDSDVIEREARRRPRAALEYASDIAPQEWLDDAAKHAMCAILQSFGSGVTMRMVSAAFRVDVSSSAYRMAEALWSQRQMRSIRRGAVSAENTEVAP